MDRRQIISNQIVRRKKLSNWIFDTSSDSILPSQQQRLASAKCESEISKEVAFQTSGPQVSTPVSLNLSRSGKISESEVPNIVHESKSGRITNDVTNGQKTIHGKFVKFFFSFLRMPLILDT